MAEQAEEIKRLKSLNDAAVTRTQNAERSDVNASAESSRA